ncbi:high frequency lysogenization protein HflD [Porticoccaceae bacterium LTM1]|nr:high frequency lysogenization protein HflD [Porticoccaceae bacterium LTM1]
MTLLAPNRDQVIALAGIFQACQLVETIAKSGTVPADSFKVCIHSLFEQSPQNLSEIYGPTANLRIGIEAMHELLTIQQSGQVSDTLRYVVGVTYLQKKMMRSRKVLNRLGEGIERAKAQAEHFDDIHENVLANLSELYQNTLSTFRYRIQVNGFAGYLQQTSTANRVRALLLAGVRSAVLWRQLGGSRLQLLFHRKKILGILHELQREL